MNDFPLWRSRDLGVLTVERTGSLLQGSASFAILLHDKAEGSLENPLDAREQLILAQVNGVDMTVSKAESPLLEARRALQVAEKQVGQKEYEQAKNNLPMAKIKLEEYRALIGNAKNTAVKEITDQNETAKK